MANGGSRWAGVVVTYVAVLIAIFLPFLVIVLRKRRQGKPLRLRAMPSSCAAYGCTSRAGKDVVSFFRFPKDADRRLAWVQATRRKGFVPYVGSRLCSKHFVTGKPSMDKCHPDYIPSLFNFPKSQGAKSADSGQVKRADRAAARRRLPLKENDGAAAAEDSVVRQDHAAAHTEDATPGTEMSTETDTTSEPTRDAATSTAELPSEIQRQLVISSLIQRIEDLEAENAKLRAENDKLRGTTGFSYNHIKDNEPMFKYYTAFPSVRVFLWFLNLLTTCCPSLCSGPVGAHDMVLMTMMKLKLALTHQDIAYRFGLSLARVSRTVNHCLGSMGFVCRKMIVWPDKETVMSNLPLCFRHPKLRNVRVVLDCFEVFTDRPKNLSCRAKTYSNYKHHNTYKVLLGISPAGAITFISESWGGRASDKHISLCSELLDLMEQGDTILADRGFTIKEEMAVYGVRVITPAFVKGRPQMSSSDVETSRLLSRARIHVERVIGRMRGNFRILKMSLPVIMFPQVDNIVAVCAAVTNLHKNIVT
ncbi:uncharacterized protein LOC122377593 [Amphibalanus amphitrite]|uniref:uncharacterized protein LOC122377593 n=1 Tax=Amphibalanus amphitrite TaxID=1232801 RepID=UPI001C928E69|nr:uncharacterized protein LOC122377593 [Amphibalanus amphitrite]